jgi:hypothetical protein
MEITGKSKLEKLRRKNRGNTLLSLAINELISDLESKNFRSHEELKLIRPDADIVHNEGFYFFNMAVHRTMILLEFEENGQATIVWCGSHDKYEATF